MTRPRKDDTPPTSVTSSTFLKIDSNLLTSKLYGDELNAKSVARLTAECTDRFKRDMVWTIDALSVHKVNNEARAGLLELFTAFRKAGGKQILAASTETFVRSAMQIAAMNGGVTLRFFHSMGEIAAELNAAAKNT
ncbi:hypothetical protein IT407_03915 [Candidatus Uhrbacteria bacterium]|nr:hypothetical protein [Candidatus Uhrbacteria bacterium]